MSGGEYSRLTSRPDSVVKDFWRSGLRAWNAASSVFSQAWSSLRIASSFLGSSMASSIETLVEEQLAAALGEVIDVAARREAQRAVHPDGRGVGFLGGGKEPGAGAFRLDGPVELPRDYLPPMIGLHDHQRDERAVEPVGRVGEASHHASIVAGDEELATVQRGLRARLGPPRPPPLPPAGAPPPGGGGGGGGGGGPGPRRPRGGGAAPRGADQLARRGGARRDIVELS